MAKPKSSALCIGVSSFGVDDEECLSGALRGLPFAGRMAAELAELLTSFGYASTCLDQPLPAAEIGAAVHRAIEQADPDGTLVIHILSHGELAPTSLHAIGGDGGYHHSTDVDGWLRTIVNGRERVPTTLFLLDLCHGGDAARPAWLPRVSDSDNRAWVIAACGPREQAFAGRFTEAVTTVLRRLAAGELDIDESREFTPLDTFARQVRRTVNELADAHGQLPQRVTASLLDLSAELPDLRFFRNMQYDGQRRRRFGSQVDAAVVPFLDDLDEALDAEHFVRRAAGRVNQYTGRLVGCFSGRSRELKILSPWINLRDEVGLRVVTGSPGVGKSALLGILVCATHPTLRPHTRDLWHPVAQAPYASDLFAAVHARQRGLAQVVASIARQLRLDLPPDDLDVERLVAAVAGLPKPPAIVVDALDEAIDGVDIMRRLLLPLASTACADGRQVRLLVGVRPWSEFAPLRAAAEAGDGLIDLDTVPAALLCDDIRYYVAGLLTLDPRWDELEVSGATHTLAHAIAKTLTEQPDRQWGAFLVAGLFTNHILRTHAEPIPDRLAAIELGRRVPHTLPALLELDLAARADTRWMRPVLTALAHALGEGMPAESIRHVAAALTDGVTGGVAARLPSFAGDIAADIEAAFPNFAAAVWGVAAPQTQQILAALDEASFYLRHSADVDGTTRYRLFHQGLADHLRDPGRAGDVFDALLASVPGRTQRQWSLAEPYLLRHLPAHAVAAGQLDTLTADAGFLIEVDPAVLLPELERAEAAAGPLVEVYRRACAASLGATREERARVLAIAAARSGDGRLARALADAPGRELAGTDGHWAPLWVSDGRGTTDDRSPGPRTRPLTADAARPPTAYAAPPDLVFAFIGNAAGGVQTYPHLLDGSAASAVECAMVAGRPLAFVGGTDGQVRAHDLATGRSWTVTRHHGRVTALSAVSLASGPVLLSGGEDARVLMTGVRGGGGQEIAIGKDVSGAVTLTTTRVGSRALAGISVGKKSGIWDLHDRRMVGRWLASELDPVVALTGGHLSGWPHVIVRSRSGRLTLRALRGQVQPRELPAGLATGVVTAHASADDLIVTGDAEGTVAVWTLSSPARSAMLTRHPGRVSALACVIVEETVYVVSAAQRSVRLTAWQRRDDGIVALPDWETDFEITMLAATHVNDQIIVVGGGSAVAAGLWSVKDERAESTGTVAGTVTVTALTATSDGSVAVLGTADGRIEVRRMAEEPATLGPFAAHGGAVVFLGVTAQADQATVVSAGRDQTVQIRGLDDGAPLCEPIPAGHDIRDVRLGRLDGRPVAALWDTAERASLWDLTTTRQIGTLSVPAQPSPGGGGAAVTVEVTDDRPVVVVDGERHEFAGHQAPVTCAALGQVAGHPRVYSGDTGGVVHIWDPHTRQTLDTVVVAQTVDQILAGDDGGLIVVSGGEVLALRHYPPQTAVPPTEPPGDPAAAVPAAPPADAAPWPGPFGEVVRRYERMVEEFTAQGRPVSVRVGDVSDETLGIVLWYSLLPPAADFTQARLLLAREAGRPGELWWPDSALELADAEVEAALDALYDPDLTTAVRGMLAIARHAEGLGFVRPYGSRDMWLKVYRPREDYATYRAQLLSQLAWTTNAAGREDKARGALMVDEWLRRLVPAAVERIEIHPPPLTSRWWGLLERSMTWVRRVAADRLLIRLPQPGEPVGGSGPDRTGGSIRGGLFPARAIPDLPPGRVVWPVSADWSGAAGGTRHAKLVYTSFDRR